MHDVPPVIQVERGHSTVFVGLGVMAAAIGAIALFVFDPSHHGFYPRCFFKMATGLDCPGCGGLRATHQLLHGHWREAFALNPLFVFSIPLIAFWAARAGAEQLMKRRFSRLVPTTAALWLGGGAIIAFGVFRNFPWHAWLR